MFRVKSTTHSISSGPMSLCSLNSERIVGHFSYIGRTKAVRCATAGIAVTASGKALKGRPPGDHAANSQGLRRGVSQTGCTKNQQVRTG
jgi:hypothetical protein